MFDIDAVCGGLRYVGVCSLCLSVCESGCRACVDMTGVHVSDASRNIAATVIFTGAYPIAVPPPGVREFYPVF